MLFNDQGGTAPDVTLAISQPAHAVVSGQILAAWADPLEDVVVLAAAQHDVAWLEWEMAPDFDATAGRPRLFRHIGAAEHAPMWERGVDRALAAWGRRVALLVSRHGSTIYRAFADRHRSPGGADLAADERAAADYLHRHAARQAAWARELGLDADAVERDAELIGFADLLSLVLCGAVPPPPTLVVGGRTLALSSSPHGYGLDPWPFAPDQLVVEIEGRPLPAGGRLPDEPAMQAWLADPARITLQTRLLRP